MKKKLKNFHVPDMAFFNNDWFLLQKFLKKEGNPYFSIEGDLNLSGQTEIESLGKLQYISGNLILTDTNISKLDHLFFVGGDLYINGITKIESFGELSYVGTFIFVDKKFDISLIPKKLVSHSVVIRLNKHEEKYYL